MISVNQLTVQFGGVDLFKDISFLVNPKDRIGLVGKNGAGKSTLLKVFMKMIESESGSVIVPTDVKLGYLPQQMVLQGGKTVLQEARLAFEEINFLKSQIEYLNNQLQIRTDYESLEYTKLIEKLTDYSEKLDIIGGNNVDAEIEQTLLGLGFNRTDFDRQTTEFSGGWRMRIELAKILLAKPNVFLLDEPTNHLDIESIQWLEDMLKSYNGALILISHDRAFLDAVTNRTVEISLGKLQDYKVPYTKYLELRKERREQQLAAYENQKKMIDDTEKFIERFRAQATKAIQVQSRIKQLEKIERIEVEEEDNSAIHFRFPPAPRSGKIPVLVEKLSKAYGEKVILQDINLEVERGKKLAFVGKNGEGKSTLSKIIVNELDFEGNCILGHNVNIGYFAQNQDELLNGDKTVFETLDDIATGDIRRRVRDILGSFLFRGEDVDKKVKVLSGGERNRLAMAKLLLEPYNLLVLDEPTNHLDIRSKEILKQALQKYDGTLIIVSHDRDFLDGLIDILYEFKDKKIKEYRGGIYDFLQKKKIENIHEIERKDVITVQSTFKEEKPSENKLTFEERKLLDKEIRKQQNKVKKEEETISKLESEIENLNNEIAKAENATNLELFETHKRINQELDRTMENWELSTLKLEELLIRRDN